MPEDKRPRAPQTVDQILKKMERYRKLTSEYFVKKPKARKLAARYLAGYMVKMAAWSPKAWEKIVLKLLKSMNRDASKGGGSLFDNVVGREAEFAQHMRGMAEAQTGAKDIGEKLKDLFSGGGAEKYVDDFMKSKDPGWNPGGSTGGGRRGGSGAGPGGSGGGAGGGGNRGGAGGTGSGAWDDWQKRWDEEAQRRRAARDQAQREADAAYEAYTRNKAAEREAAKRAKINEKLEFLRTGRPRLKTKPEEGILSRYWQLLTGEHAEGLEDYAEAVGRRRRGAVDAGIYRNMGTRYRRVEDKARNLAGEERDRVGMTRVGTGAAGLAGGVIGGSMLWPDGKKPHTEQKPGYQPEAAGAVAGRKGEPSFMDGLSEQWYSMSPALRKSMVHAGIGAGAGGLLGAGAGYMTGMNPLMSGLLGTLAGGAIGGIEGYSIPGAQYE